MGGVSSGSGTGLAQAGRGSQVPCRGAKPMDAVLMFKMLVLSALYNLSDDQIGYQVCDQLSFT